MGPMGRRGRRRGLIVGAAVGAGMANRNNKNAAADDTADTADAAQAAPAQDDDITQLQELAKLKDQGILTQEEFDAKKKQILGI